LDGGRWQVQSYLEHHGAKLARRFDAGSYVALTEAMNSHDIGRSRGGQEAALARITARSVVVGVDSDRLYPLVQQERLAAGLAPELLVGGLQVVRSPFGHDSFLIESAAIAAAVAPLLA
jgi:homoserine O-acetyltransferase/O-succinyltransferase